eukprot:192654-Alexandrium_andersonii.AAC.1
MSASLVGSEMCIRDSASRALVSKLSSAGASTCRVIRRKSCPGRAPTGFTAGGRDVGLLDGC